MKLILFGATGGIGRETVRQALDAGHTVTAAARRPAAITLTHERLTVVRGDVTDSASVTALMPGHDAAISTIGEINHEPTTLFSSGLRNIMAAMTVTGIKRLICISANGLEPGGPPVIRSIIKSLLWRAFREHYIDLVRMEAVIKASDLNWTILRPPMLINGPHKSTYHIAINKPLPSSWSISRADVADFIVHHLADAATYKAVVELAY
jgi:putative NADH-flavin reductase